MPLHHVTNDLHYRIMDHSGLSKLHLTADIAPKLTHLELRNIPEKCKFHVVVPTLKNIWIHHFTVREHKTGCINDMLAAATELETFETYKLWVYQPIHFAGNHLKTIDLHRSDEVPDISIWAPNLEKLRLQACYSIKNIEILESHPLAEMLPEGHEPTTFRVNTLNANIGRKARKSLKGCGRCFFEVDESEMPHFMSQEDQHRFFANFMDDYDEEEKGLAMKEGMIAWNNKQFEKM